MLVLILILILILIPTLILILILYPNLVIPYPTLLDSTLRLHYHYYFPNIRSFYSYADILYSIIFYSTIRYHCSTLFYSCSTSTHTLLYSNVLCSNLPYPTRVYPTLL